ncbi:GldL-related protein [Carboxylicivirga linearis]|uniref:Gliding motility protein GldL-like N-terminal domain-containing protein n=1 Tax=Carboxylicivirga linearis TaxID=1628157 RepID=A0ABS5JYY7_9BACT|nr:hypothetical protein [Carboxylicivirga linearis]MBS2099616.1 hypothetical protein [Carboxylicivirga linearis]
MKKLEIILGIIATTAFIMNLFFVPGSSLLILLSLGTLTILYYAFSLLLFNKIDLNQIGNRYTYQGISKLRIIGSIAAGIVLSTTYAGIMFKLIHYPGATIVLNIGLITNLVVFIVILIKHLRINDNYYLRILKRIMIIGGIGLMLVSISELTIVKFKFRNYPEYINIYEAHINDPQNEELRIKKEIEFYRITMSEEEFKTYMDYRQNQLKE